MNVDARVSGWAELLGVAESQLLAMGALEFAARVAAARDGRTVFKRCACGAEYTRAEFGALEYVGELDDLIKLVELRNCSRCGSTLAIEIGDSSSVPTQRAPQVEASL